METLTKTTSFFTSDVQALRFDYSALGDLETFKRPTIFLGLGGGGCRAVSMVKDMFTRTFHGKTEPGAGPIPAGFQFLGFDSATSDQPPNLDTGTEWVQLAGSGISGAEWDRLKNDPQFSKWVPQGFSGVDFPQGCSGYRTLGRFLFNVNISTFEQKFRSHYDMAMQHAEENTKPVVYVFCTLAGGTGSGCLLDACFHLRATYPGLAIMGFLALAEGFGSSSHLHHRSKVGVFAAIKEIDQFMNQSRLSEWIQECRERDPEGSGLEEDGTFIFPFAKGIKGKFTKPFDCCFPFGSYNNKGLLTLEKSESMSAFMARVAFSLAVYPPDEGGQAFESSRNNFGDQLIEVVSGANVSYMVPGLAGIHTPVEHVRDLMSLEGAKLLISHLNRGHVREEHQHEAEGFLTEIGFGLASLEKLADILIRIDGQLDALESDATMKRLDAILDDPKQRHQESGAKTLRQPFEDALKGALADTVFNNVSTRRPNEEDARLARVAAEGVERDFAMQKLASFPLSLERFQEEFGAKANAFFCDTNYRRLGTMDFVEDTLALLEQSLSTARKRLASAETVVQSMAKDVWDSGSEFRGFFEGMVKDDGVLDRMMENAKEKDLRSSYESHLREVYALVRQIVVARSCVTVLERAVGFAEKKRQQFETIFAEYHNASKRIQEKINLLEDHLYEQAARRVDSADFILSKNLMDRAWRERYVKSIGLEDSEERCDNLVTKARRMAGLGDDGLHPWRKIDWHPLKVIEIFDSPIENPAKQPLANVIAQDFANAAMRAVFDEFNPFTVWKDGQGILKAFEYAAPEGAKMAAKELVESLLHQCQPQYEMGETTRLPVTLERYSMFAGPKGVGEHLLRDVLGGHTMNRVTTFESHRVSLVTFTYPVGFPICQRVRIHLQTAYDSHFAKISEAAREDEYRRFHSYERASEWRNPYEIDEPPGPAELAFCRAYLVSSILGNGSGISHEKTRQCVEAALAEMHRLTEAPRSKGLAIFIAGGNEFWLTPFCSLDSAGRNAGVPVKIAVGLSQALSNISRTREWAAEAEAWASWFRENKASIFSDEELAEARRRLLADLREKVARNPGDASKAWRKILDAASGDFIFTS